MSTQTELSSVTNSGTLTVAGTLSRPAVDVVVSGTGFASPDLAELYSDNTWARQYAFWTEGSNYYSATAQDYPYGRHATNSVVSYPSVSNFFVYDSNGNLRTNGTRIFDYDDENQLIAITEPGQWKSEFAYDGLMRRRVRKESIWLAGNWQLTNEVHYIYDGRLPVQERTWVPIGGGFLHVRYITYTRGADMSGSLQGAGGIGGLLARSDSAPSILGLPEDHNFYADDGMGNITLLINTNGYASANYAYDPFGSITSRSGPLADENLYRFSSKEADSRSGLSYYLYRFYDPVNQRWLNRDPIEEIGGPNLFQFSANSPQIWVDAWGTDPFEKFQSLDAAGKDSACYIGRFPQVNRGEKVEQAASLFQTPDKQYYYNIPQHGHSPDPNSASADMKGESDKDKLVGEAHNHTKGENFSSSKDWPEGTPKDIERYKDKGLVGYLLTPSGDVKKYDPATGKTTSLGHCK